MARESIVPSLVLPPPQGRAEWERMFGRPDGTSVWERRNLGFCDLTDLRMSVGHLYYPLDTQRIDYFATRHNPYTLARGYGFACHRKLEAVFHLLFQRLVERGLMGHLRTVDGTYAYRLVRGGSTLSPHAYGMAIDFDAQWNQLGWGPERAEMHSEIVMVAEGLGWTWGGRFSRPDPMHFQYGAY